MPKSAGPIGQSFSEGNRMFALDEERKRTRTRQYGSPGHVSSGMAAENHRVQTQYILRRMHVCISEVAAIIGMDRQVSHDASRSAQPNCVLGLAEAAKSLAGASNLVEAS